MPHSILFTVQLHGTEATFVASFDTNLEQPNIMQTSQFNWMADKLHQKNTK